MLLIDEIKQGWKVDCQKKMQYLGDLTETDLGCDGQTLHWRRAGRRGPEQRALPLSGSIVAASADFREKRSRGLFSYPIEL